MTSTPSGRPSRAADDQTRRSNAAFDHDRRVARLARITILATTDLAALMLAGALAYSLWALPARGQSVLLYLELLPLFSLFLIGYAQSGLYPGFGLGPVETLRRQSSVTGFGFLVLAAFSFALKLPHLYSRVTFVITLGLSLLFVPLTRAAVVHVASRWRWWNEPIAVVGTGERAIRAIRGIQHGHFGYSPIAVLSPHPTIVGHLEGVRVAGDLSQAAALAQRGVRVAMIAGGTVRDLGVIDELQRHFRHVILLREFDDLPVEGIQIRALGAMVGIEYTNNLLLPGNRAIKRMLDLIVGSVALLLAAPIIAVTTALIRMVDGAPMFYLQSRAGFDGRRITVPKVRTMKRDAENQLEEFLSVDSGLRAEWETHQKLKDDPRLIPTLGKLLRRFSLDELPQLWSVLRGDMSLVGPRPFPDYHLAKFSPTFLELRQRVRPGITGLWQVEIRSEGSIAEQEAFDSYYIRNWSVWLDLYVLGRTIGAFAAGRGAY